MKLHILFAYFYLDSIQAYLSMGPSIGLHRSSSLLLMRRYYP